MWEGLTKNKAKKHKNKEQFPECQQKHSGKRSFPECQRWGTRGRGHLPRVLEHGTRGSPFHNFLRTPPSNVAVKRTFSFACARLPRGLHSGKMAFPECLASSSVMPF
jgi:hypothetical protein